MTFNDLSISESAIETTGVQSQPDTLTGTAAENKLVFDALPQLIVARFNMLITQLQAQAAAEQLGVTPFTGMTATNLQDALEALQTNLTQAIAGVGTGLAGSSGAASVGFDSTEQITAATVQAAIEAVQQHLDVFKTQMTGSGGAASVGTAPISGLDATNVQAALAELRDDIQNIVSGIIPGGTITTNMLADGSVTAAKLNVTGEDIPTSTTDAISLSSQLSNKLGMPTEIEAGQDLNDYTSPGLYFCGEFAQSVENIPPDSITGAFSLFVEKTGAYGNGVKQTFTEHNPGFTYIRLMSDTSMSHWSDWKQIATATPPEGYVLPLASGFTKLYCASYSKTQEGMVTVTLWLAGSGAANVETTIATLPEGFRPAELFRADGIVDTGTISSQEQCGIAVNAAGAIVVQSKIAWVYVSGIFTFRAAD